jgi:hypothetical protein
MSAFDVGRVKSDALIFPQITQQIQKLPLSASYLQYGFVAQTIFCYQTDCRPALVFIESRGITLRLFTVGRIIEQPWIKSRVKNKAAFFAKTQGNFGSLKIKRLFTASYI